MEVNAHTQIACMYAHAATLFGTVCSIGREQSVLEQSASFIICILFVDVLCSTERQGKPIQCSTERQGEPIQ